MSDDDARFSRRRARPLDRRERLALVALADQIDRESPALAIGIRGFDRAAGRPGRGPTPVRRGAVPVVMFVLAVLGAASAAVGSGLVWGPAGLAVSSGVLVAVLAALTLHRACR